MLKLQVAELLNPRPFTWAGQLAMLLTVYTNGSLQARHEAESELRKMAIEADCFAMFRGPTH